jgi:hypothetical protein
MLEQGAKSFFATSTKETSSTAGMMEENPQHQSHNMHTQNEIQTGFSLLLQTNSKESRDVMVFITRDQDMLYLEQYQINCDFEMSEFCKIGQGDSFHFKIFVNEERSHATIFILVSFERLTF